MKPGILVTTNPEPNTQDRFAVFITRPAHDYLLQHDPALLRELFATYPRQWRLPGIRFTRLPGDVVARVRESLASFQ